MGEPIIPSRTNNYQDNIANFSYITGTQDIIIETLIDLSFSKINRFFLQNSAINTNIRFDTFIRGRNVANINANNAIPTTPLNLSIDKFKNSQYFITNYNIVLNKNDPSFSKFISNGTTYIQNIVLNTYIAANINAFLLDSIINLNIIFKDDFYNIVDTSGNGAIKIDFSLFNNKYLQTFNIINNTLITGKHGEGLANWTSGSGDLSTVTVGTVGRDAVIMDKARAGGKGEDGGNGQYAINIITTSNKNIKINIYDDNNKIKGGFGAIGGDGGNGGIPYLYYIPSSYKFFSANQYNNTGVWSVGGGTYIYNEGNDLWAPVANTDYASGGGYGWPGRNIGASDEIWSEFILSDRYFFRFYNGSGSGRYSTYERYDVRSYNERLDVNNLNFIRLNKTTGTWIGRPGPGIYRDNIYKYESPAFGGTVKVATFIHNANNIFTATKSNGIPGKIMDYSSGQRYPWCGDAGLAGSDGSDGPKIRLKVDNNIMSINDNIYTYSP